jgi:toxin ParE1/3/4
MKVRFTEAALAEIESIFAYVAAETPTAAHRIVERVEQIVSRLSEFPMLGHAVDEAGVRIVPPGRFPYLVFYTQSAGEVLILHVRHAARQRP